MHKVSECSGQAATDVSLLVCDCICCTKLELQLHTLCQADPIWYICTYEPRILLDCTCQNNRQQHSWVHSICCILTDIFLTTFWHNFCTNFFICTECCGTLGTLGDLKFKYWSWRHKNWNVLIAFFSSCRQIKEYCLKLGNSLFSSHPYQYAMQWTCYHLTPNS
jgi:hypothetical protein